jgi:hypothetical protein
MHYFAIITSLMMPCEDPDETNCPYLRVRRHTIHDSVRLRGYRHADLAPVLAMGHRQAVVVDRNVPIVAEPEECVVQHSWEPRTMLARGTKAPILSNGDMGVVVHVHPKTQT